GPKATRGDACARGLCDLSSRVACVQEGSRCACDNRRRPDCERQPSLPLVPTSGTPIPPCGGSHQWRPATVQTHDRLPSASSSTQYAGAAASLTSVPPAATAASTRRGPSSIGTQTSMCQRCSNSWSGRTGPSSSGSCHHTVGACPLGSTGSPSWSCAPSSAA